ncbi:transcription factor Pcc1-domain-containing protein [Massariosphaeria phaeospora]|uniref:Transcription factor Pcc1-domain-containing protein n=1 Tax=Massariosphaeria phaeospora TaxID=100035 RepID=A0A7C8M1Z0_9PLEO|nr:transcription factor Pcc1-domain-containing protein [Massariosphaeria phaeospora]
MTPNVTFAHISLSDADSGHLKNRKSAAMAESKDAADEFPCRLTLNIPFPTPRLASTALRAIAVDRELSPLVRRSFSLVSAAEQDSESTEQNVLCVEYTASTNRSLRVAVNGFFESIGVVVSVMKELDVDVAYGPVEGGLDGVQGLQGVEG